LIAAGGCQEASGVNAISGLGYGDEVAQVNPGAAVRGETHDLPLVLEPLETEIAGELGIEQPE
jgi:hypothetical protein